MQILKFNCTCGAVHILYTRTSPTLLGMLLATAVIWMHKKLYNSWLIPSKTKSNNTHRQSWYTLQQYTCSTCYCCLSKYKIQDVIHPTTDVFICCFLKVSHFYYLSSAGYKKFNIIQSAVLRCCLPGSIDNKSSCVQFNPFAVAIVIQVSTNVLSSRLLRPGTHLSSLALQPIQSKRKSLKLEGF